MDHGLYRDADGGKGSMMNPIPDRGDWVPTDDELEIVRSWEDYLETPGPHPSVTDKYDNTLEIDDMVLFAHGDKLKDGRIMDIQHGTLIIYDHEEDRDHTRNPIYTIKLTLTK